MGGWEDEEEGMGGWFDGIDVVEVWFIGICREVEEELMFYFIMRLFFVRED